MVSEYALELMFKDSSAEYLKVQRFNIHAFNFEKFLNTSQTYIGHRPTVVLEFLKISARLVLINHKA